MPALGSRPHHADEWAVTDHATEAALNALNTVGLTKSWVEALHCLIALLIVATCLVIVISIIVASRTPSIEEAEQDLIKRKAERAAKEYFVKQAQQIAKDVEQELRAENP